MPRPARNSSPSRAHRLTAGLQPGRQTPGRRSRDKMAKAQTVKVWDARPARNSLPSRARTGRSWPSARTASVWPASSADNTVKVWDAQTGQELFSFRIGPSAGVAFSPDGKRLATASGRWLGGARWDGVPGDVKVWDAQTGQELLSLKGFAGPYPSLAFSPDGKRLASSQRPSNSLDRGDFDEIKVWDAQTGQELLTLKGHIAAIQSVVFSPDGKRLASSARLDQHREGVGCADRPGAAQSQSGRGDQ